MTTENRPDAKLIEERKKQKKKAEKELNEKLKNNGLQPVDCPQSKPNRKCQYQSTDEEKEARNFAATEQFRLLRNKLPVLLKRLKKIEDPRNPKKIKYSLSMLMIYGILFYVFQMSSRRKANETLTRPMFLENLKIFIPELDKIPHGDTLLRLLEKIDVADIEKAQLDLVRDLIKKKKFVRYLIHNNYPIAIDGTQKFKRSYIWDENCLQRRVGDKDEKQYYVYVLEASLAFHNGMTIPLMSEFLSYTEGFTESEKQDCELKGFKRLTNRLKKEFKRLPIMLLLDGLYPNGPVFTECRKKRWDFMIVLKDDSLKSVWREYEALKDLEPGNIHVMNFNKRAQRFKWVNDIDYYYDHDKKTEKVHLVVCRETWKEIDKKTLKPVEKKSKHTWISNKPLTKSNVHQRCNEAARRRWNIENQINDEKCHGYNYSHCYSYNWNAMKGFHFLMNIGRTINVLAQYSECLVKEFIEKGIQGFIKFVRDTMAGPWLDIEKISKRLRDNFQLRLV